MTPEQGWKEVRRYELGVSVGTSKDVGAHFHIVYQILERRTYKGETEWRERLVHGRALCQCKERLVATAGLLEAVAAGVRALTAIARTNDDRATPKRNRR